MNQTCCVSVGAVVVRRRFGNWAFLLLRSGEQWGLPVAVLEEDESGVDGLRRLVRESTAVVGLHFYWGHHYYPLSVGDDSVRFLLAESAGGDVSLAAEEQGGAGAYHEHRWASLAGAVELLPAPLRPVIEWAEAILAGSDGTPGAKR